MENKLWVLFYRGEVVLRGVPFPVLVAKKNELIRTGNYRKDYFVHKFHKK